MFRRSAHVGAGAQVLRSRLAPSPRSLRGSAGRSYLGWGLVGAGVLVGFFYLTWSVISMLFAAAVFAWLLDGPVRALERRGVSRQTACFMVGLGLVASGVGVVVLIVPRVVNQVAELSTNIVPYVQRLSDALGPWVAVAEARLGIHVPVDMNELGQELPSLLKKISPDARARVQEWLQAAAQGSLSFVLSMLSLSLLPLFTFYLLRDWPQLLASVEGLAPEKLRATVRTMASQIDERLAGFVRGQLTVALVLGVVYSSGLLACGIDLAITVGMLGGALFLVPYLGTLVAGGLAVVLALMEFGLDWHVVAAAAVFVAGQLIEGTFLTPWLVGDRVGLHPMIVMVALVVGGNLLGIWGLVLAVPVTAALAVVGGHLLARWKSSRTYRGA